MAVQPHCSWLRGWECGREGERKQAAEARVLLMMMRIHCRKRGKKKFKGKRKRGREREGGRKRGREEEREEGGRERGKEGGRKISRKLTLSLEKYCFVMANLVPLHVALLVDGSLKYWLNIPPLTTPLAPPTTPLPKG